MTRRLVLAFLAALSLAAAPFDPCPPLFRTPGPIVTVTPAQANDLPRIVRAAAPFTTILLADGTYRMTLVGEGLRRLRFEKPNVTLRSASNNAAKVVIDAEYRTDEAVYIAASNVTIAHLTVTHARHHLIHVTPPVAGPGVDNVLVYGVRLTDGGQQFVKINANGAKTHFVDHGRIQCSEFLMTEAGRSYVPVAGDQRCYTGGVDAHMARGWQVSWNRFVGIYCTNGALAEHAIHFWSASRDTLVENNTIINCGRGIGFGLVENGVVRTYADRPYADVVGYIGHYDGTIRNNVVYSDIDFHDVGVELDQARGAKVYGNTIVSAKRGRFYTSIDVRFRNTLVEVFDNLVQAIKVRNDGQMTADRNVYDVGPEKLNAPWAGDYRLKIEPPALGVDMHGLPRKAGTAGAFEAPQ